MTPATRSPCDPVVIRPIGVYELEVRLARLSALLREAVGAGGTLGFLFALTEEAANTYWLSLHPELKAGTRLLLGAYIADELVGAGQLAFPRWSNAGHRAEVQKVFVAGTVQGRGVGKALMIGLHEAALKRGRWLLLLNTRHRGPAERFYGALGYREVGVIPAYANGPEGEWYDSITLYLELGRKASEQDEADRTEASR